MKKVNKFKWIINNTIIAATILQHNQNCKALWNTNSILLARDNPDLGPTSYGIGMISSIIIISKDPISSTEAVISEADKDTWEEMSFAQMAARAALNPAEIAHV